MSTTDPQAHVGEEINVEYDVECKDCRTRFEGGRSEARRARWEPWSTATQQSIDHGPMVCPTCVEQLLAGVIDALREA
jgi:hypothetical protein